MSALQRSPDPLPPDDILRFPRGAAAGECIHKLFETIDFTDPTGWPSAIDAALARHPQPGADRNPLPAMLQRMLDDVLGTPLPIGTELRRIPAARRLIELGFTLPAEGLDTTRLAEALGARGYRIPPLSTRMLQGYLVGFVDLVFEHGGRFHILDWKSNLLGHTASDYDGTALGEAMDREGYGLQYLFYCVALHRYLQARMGAGYDYDAHFGSVLYLFVRGVRPGWTASDGSATGIYHHRPARETIEMLSAMLSPVGEPA
jgi:exodeoxyribonuclease V beta subunit